MHSSFPSGIFLNKTKNKGKQQDVCLSYYSLLCNILQQNKNFKIIFTPSIIEGCLPLLVIPGDLRRNFFVTPAPVILRGM